MLILTFCFWLFLCVAAAMFADIRRKRNGFGWFVVAFFFSPLVAFILLAILEPLPADRRDLDARPPRPSSNVVPAIMMISVLVAFLGFLVWGFMHA
jgi:hypothetical protein